MKILPDHPQLLPIQLGAHPDPSDNHSLQSVILPSLSHPHTRRTLHTTSPRTWLRWGERRQILVRVGDQIDRKASPPGCLPSFLDRRRTRSPHARHTKQPCDLSLRLVEFCFIPCVDVRVEKLLVSVLRGGRYWGSPSKLIRGRGQRANDSLVDGWRMQATTGVGCSCGRRA